jgi:hypothetical protein
VTNKILVAIQASKVSNLSFLNSEEVVVARGDLTSRYPVETANLLIAGVNMGLHYALMFGIPQGRDVEEMQKNYYDVDKALNTEIKELLNNAGIIKDLLNYEDEDDNQYA